MPQYHYPSGARIPDGDVNGWLIGLHIVFAVLLIGALAVFVWRCFRKVSLWDVPGWIVVAVAGWSLARWAYPILDHMPDTLFVIFVLSLVVAIVAGMVTIGRSIKQPAAKGCFLLFGFGCIAVIFLLPAAQQAKEAQRRTICKNQLRSIGLAMENYHDVHQQFPYAGVVTSDAGQICSWRVAIIPQLEAIPWYKYYHFDEPWDSEFNRRNLDRVWSPYTCPTHQITARFTSYAMLTGPGTFGGDGRTATKLDDITDGTSNTLMIVEACGREIIWTEPKDVEVTEDSLGINLPGDRPGHSRGILSSHHTGGAHALLADGTVRFFSETMDKSVLKSLTTIAVGETVPEY